MNKASFSIKDAFGFGWAMFKEKLWFLLGLVAISGLFAALPDVVAKLTDDKIVFFLAQVISVVIGFVVDAGLIYVMLRLRDGKETKISDVFSQYPIVFQYFVAGVLYGVMVVGLPVLFVVYRLNDSVVNHTSSLFYARDLFILIPLCILSMYLVLRYQFYKYSLVDNYVDIVDSFKQSAKITDGQKWQLLRFSLAIIGINLLGLLVFGVGLFVTVPVTMLATVYVYRKLSAPVEEPEPLEESKIVLEPLDQSISIDEKVSKSIETLAPLE
jgi:hypothetical protein